MVMRIRNLSVEYAQYQGENWVKRGAGNETVTGERRPGEKFWGAGRRKCGYHPCRKGSTGSYEMHT